MREGRASRSAAVESLWGRAGLSAGSRGAPRSFKLLTWALQAFVSVVLTPRSDEAMKSEPLDESRLAGCTSQLVVQASCQSSTRVQQQRSDAQVKCRNLDFLATCGSSLKGSHTLLVLVWLDW